MEKSFGWMGGCIDGWRLGELKSYEKRKKQGEEVNGVVEVRELATTFPSVCTGWIEGGGKNGDAQGQQED